MAASLLLTCAAVGAPLGCATETSPQRVARKVGQPQQDPFFGNQVLYMGDRDGYRYVHVRSLHSYLGDRDYKVPAENWNMQHPMRYSTNPLNWRDVTWMNGDAIDFQQNAFLNASPSFPEGAPATQPFASPAAQQRFEAPAMPDQPAGGPATQPMPAAQPAVQDLATPTLPTPPTITTSPQSAPAQ